MPRLIGKHSQDRKARNVRRVSSLRRKLAASAIASASILTAASPAHAGTLAVTGASATYSSSFSSGLLTTTGTVRMTIKDALADGYCVHGSVTFNVSLAPDPTYNSPQVCGYGAAGAWTISLKKTQPLRVNGMLMKVCKTIPSAPDPCDSEYVGR